MSSFPEAVLSVTGLTAYIQSLIDDDEVLQQVWVTGEVSSANRYRSGLFFTLQDPEAQAAISCVVWNSTLQDLFVQPTPGTQLIVLGRVQVYPQRSTYQLVVWQAIPAGEGLKALRYRQLRDRLAAEGLFDADRKRPLPPHPQTIAVVTSPQAAAWGDIQRTLRSRYPGLRVLLSPALVQGEHAPASIVKAIERVEQDGRAEVLILSRGGGATEDLDCFNDERVVRAIALAKIPIVAGIGHERDASLADWVADVHVHTPTAAAEHTVPSLQTLWLAHHERRGWLRSAVVNQMVTQTQLLSSFGHRLQRVSLPAQLGQQFQRLHWLRQRLVQAVQHQQQHVLQQTQLLDQKLQALDPQAVLNRGYAVVWQSNGQVVRHAGDLEPGEQVTVRLGTGQIQAQVTEILPHSDAAKPSSSKHHEKKARHLS
jgi:exodeoxyribonuclease VII large subunit